mgnify:CR=1 FL=1
MKEVSLDAGPYGEAQNVVTSCFARLTGSASAILPVIYWDADNLQTHRKVRTENLYLGNPSHLMALPSAITHEA